MLRKIIVITIIAINVLCLSGCKKKSGQEKPGSAELNTTAEYQAEAKEQINKKNMAEELEKIEKSLEEDVSGQ